MLDLLLNSEFVTVVIGLAIVGFLGWKLKNKFWK